MSSKVEEVARAIYEDRNGHGCKPWGRLTKSHRFPYLADARAAIKAMREPTLEMLESGDANYRATGTSGVSGMTIEAQIRAKCARFGAGWSAAIGAALSEEGR